MSFVKLIIKSGFLLLLLLSKFFKKILIYSKQVRNFVGYISIAPSEFKSDFFYTRDFFRFYYIPTALLVNNLLIFLNEELQWVCGNLVKDFGKYYFHYRLITFFELTAWNLWFFFIKSLDFLDCEWDIWRFQFLPILSFNIFVELPLELDLVFGEVYYVYFIPLYRSFEFIDTEDDHEAMKVRLQREK